LGCPENIFLKISNVVGVCTNRSLKILLVKIPTTGTSIERSFLTQMGLIGYDLFQLRGWCLHQPYGKEKCLFVGEDTNKGEEQYPDLQPLQKCKPQFITHWQS